MARGSKAFPSAGSGARGRGDGPVVASRKGASFGPPITIRCDCAEVGYVAYGEVWTCTSCGRRWNTRQIPEADYRRIIDHLRWFKVQAIGGVGSIVVVFGSLALVVADRMILLMPFAMVLWGLWFLPRRRRSFRDIARTQATWNLRPE